MRKILAVGAALIFLMGCANDNQIKIQNDSATDLTFNFRAQSIIAYSGKTNSISEIPNGSFDYDISTITPPAGYTLGSVPAGGNLLFQKKSTKWLFVFSSNYVTPPPTYNVTLSKTSSDGGSVTGP
jgi:hypothetical protein